MKKKLYSTVKNVAYSGLFYAGIAHGMGSSLIHKNNIDTSITQVAEYYLTLQGINPFKIPARLQSEYQQKLADARKKLTANGRIFTNLQEIDTTVRESLDSFMTNMSTVVLRDILDMQLMTSINQHMQQRGFSISQIPLNDLDEYNARLGNVTKTLNSLMLHDGRDYVRIDEINKAIKEEFTPFIARLKLAQGAPESANDWWTSFFNMFIASTSHQQSSPVVAPVTPSMLKIMRHELNDRTLQAANAALRTSNIDPENIGDVYVAPYANTIQHIIRTMDDTMKRTGRNYVWQDDLAVETLRQLQPLVQKIRQHNALVSATLPAAPGGPNSVQINNNDFCSVCQYGYQQQQRLSILSCGHHFHKDCIYKALEYKKQCPICGANNVIVAKQLDVTHVGALQ